LVPSLFLQCPLEDRILTQDRIFVNINFNQAVAVLA
jgi:hypothetical protein